MSIKDGPRESPARPELGSVPLFSAFGGDLLIAPTRPGRIRGDFSLGWPALHAVTDAESSEPAPAVPRRGAPVSAASVDWDQAASLRNVASKRLTNRLSDAAADDTTRRELGRAVILEVVQEATDARFAVEGSTWSVGEQQALAKAVFDLMFGLGRLQPLVDRDDVEDIICVGHARVRLNLIDGRTVDAPPVAGSQEEFVQLLQDLAARNEPPRPFSEANPSLHLNLDGIGRLAAQMSVTHLPSVVIRRHRMVRVSLDDLVDLGTITPIMASFLSAAVKARRSIVVSGAQGDGKTTMLRALCSEIGQEEVIGTFETERELGLERLTDQHPSAFSWEERPGSGELGANGKPIGQYSLQQAMRDSFRMILSRQIVGEVRGPEVAQMIMAMESGSGSMSTTHAESAAQAMEKLISCAVQSGEFTRESAVMKLARCLHLVVQMRTMYSRDRDGNSVKRRVVDEIIAVSTGDADEGYSADPVFKRNADGPAVPYILPDPLRHLLAGHGFAVHTFIAEAQRGGVA